MPDGYNVMPHWHSEDEQLTVVNEAAGKAK
jgi:hypothetical protein